MSGSVRVAQGGEDRIHRWPIGPIAACMTKGQQAIPAHHEIAASLENILGSEMDRTTLKHPAKILIQYARTPRCERGEPVEAVGMINLAFRI